VNKLEHQKVQQLINDLLSEIGEDPKREGLLNTPKRVAKAYEFLTGGYNQKIEQVLNKAIFHEKYDEMVLVKDIDFYSLCEHHMLPFYGKVHVAYILTEKL
jgi:GTP cyclohydrolase IA